MKVIDVKNITLYDCHRGFNEFVNEFMNERQKILQELKDIENIEKTDPELAAELKKKISGNEKF